MAEYVYVGDNYWDSQDPELLDKRGKQISHQEQYEFMTGYPDDSPQMTKSRSSNLEIMLLASRFS